MFSALLTFTTFEAFDYAGMKSLEFLSSEKSAIYVRIWLKQNKYRHSDQTTTMASECTKTTLHLLLYGYNEHQTPTGIKRGCIIVSILEPRRFNEEPMTLHSLVSQNKHCP